MYKLDQIDVDILRILQRDANVGVKYLAKALNLTKTPIYERIKRLEQDGIIQKYVALVNSKKIGNNIIVFCSVSLDVQKLPEIELFNAAIMELPEVLECYLMGGSNDFLLKVMVEDLDAYHQFSSGKLAALENVNQIKSSFVLNEVKKSTVIPTL
jgi:Lrp/AsnC family transcriptional regulator